jgi:hypothetical protein
MPRLPAPATVSRRSSLPRCPVPPSLQVPLPIFAPLDVVRFIVRAVVIFRPYFQPFF